MRPTLWGLAAIIVIGAIIVPIAPLFISAEDVRNKLFAELEAATGYRLRVSGPIHISVFPSLDLVAEDVGVAQSVGPDGIEIATAKTLRFGLALSELLSGKVRVTEIALIEPVIAIPERAPAEAVASGEPGSGGTSVATALQSLSLDKLVVKNGTVTLPGAPGKRITAVMLEASLPAFGAPLSVSFKAVLDRKPVQLAGSIGNFGPFLDGAAAPVSFDFEAPAYFTQKLALAGTATYTGEAFALDGFTAKSGDSTFGGSVSADLSGNVPRIDASLNSERLDLNALLPAGGGANAPATASGASAGWSDAKIDFSVLNTVNAKLALSVRQLIYDRIKAGPVGIKATIASGKLDAELPGLKLYNGDGAGALSVDASGKTPVQTFRFSLANLDTYPFLEAAADFQSIEGRGTIAVELTASGSSQRAIISALSGTARLEFADGAIRGINVARMVRSLTSGTLSGWQSAKAEKTDFAALGASFKIAKGRAQSDDLHLTGPLVRMTGKGSVDLPTRMLDLRVDPQVVASLEGQGGKNDLQGLGVPVVIAGPWARPAIYPDIAGILNDPVAAYERLRKLGGGVAALPDAEALTDKLGGTGGVAGMIKKKTGVSIEELIKVDQPRQGAISGLEQLIKNQQAAAPASAQPDAEQVPEPDADDAGKQKAKKRVKPQAHIPTDPNAGPEATAMQLMRNLLGN